MDSELREHYLAFFRGAAGRKVLADLIEYTGFNNPCYQPGMESNEVAHHSGLKQVIYYIYSALDTTTEKELEDGIYGFEDGID